MGVNTKIKTLLIKYLCVTHPAPHGDLMGYIVFSLAIAP
jgi:hypothetical protein